MTDISAVVQLTETVLQATLGGTPDPGDGTAVTLGASVDDVLSLAGQQLNAEGPAGDVLVFWDASAGKMTHLSLAAGLSITGTTLTVTAAGTGTVTSVNITPPAAGITVSGGPVTSSGSITLSLANDLAAIEGLTTTGIVRRTGVDTWTAGGNVNLATEVTGLLPYASLSGAPNLALKADLVGGVIPTSQLPSLAVTDFLGTAANQAAMLALSGQRGDWSIRTDAGANGGTWVLIADGGSSLAHWQRLGYPIAPVSSVNSQTGDIVLGFGDVGAASAAQGALAASAIQPGDPALSEPREWTATTISQADAEAGTATARQAFTAQRVRQAIVAWWATISSTIATLTGTQTLTNKTLGNLRETVFTITDAAGFLIDPANGPLQTVTLGANRTPSFANFLDGQSVKLSINDGAGFTITFSGGPVTWLFPLGGAATAPTLATTGLTHIELWREGAVFYGALIGYTA